MLNIHNTKRIFVSIFVLLLLFGNAFPTFAFQINDKGHPDLASIVIKRKVSVNNEAAVSNFTVKSGDRIVTGDDASAIINLPGFGSIELFSSTTLVVNFSEKGVFPELLAGRIHIISDALTDVRVKTPNGFVVAEKSKSKSFAVEIGCEDECIETFSEVFANSVEMEVKDKSTSKTILSGNRESSGPLSVNCANHCKKPIILKKKSPVYRIAGLIGGIATALIAAVLLSNGGNPTDVQISSKPPVSPMS